jgi:hypothetical protein
MPSLDHNGGYVVATFAITVTVLAGYFMYVLARLRGVERALLARAVRNARSR